jgi:PIN domain nuclease of toxin-antitoxin system
MKVLLATYAFIWWDSAPAKLSPPARAACQDRANLVCLSVASVWEMQIKLQPGKLHLRLPLAEVIAGQQQTNDIQVLPSPSGTSWHCKTCRRITRTRLTGC